MAQAREAEAALEAALREDLPALSRRPGDLVRPVRAARAAQGHRGPGRRAGPQRPRRRRAGDPGRPRPRASSIAEAERVRAQEQQIDAEVAAQPHRARRRPLAARQQPSRPTPRRTAGSPALLRAAADRREGLARLHGQVNALRSRAPPPTRRSAGWSRPAQEAVARAEQAAARLHRPGDPGRRARRRRGGPRRRARGRVLRARRRRGPAGQDPRGGAGRRA